MEFSDNSEFVSPKVEKLDETQELYSEEENDENCYQIKNNGIYYRNDLLIARIVYQCVDCIQVFNTISNSHKHYKSLHQNNSNNNSLNDNSIDSDVNNNTDINEDNNNSIDDNLSQQILNINQNPVKSQSILLKTKSSKKSNQLNRIKSETNDEKNVDSDENLLRRREGLRKRVVIKLNKRCINTGCNNRVKSSESNDLCERCYAQLFRFNEKTSVKRNTKTPKVLYKCEFCEKSFRNRKLLISHRNCHTLPYVCSFNGCNESFSSITAQRTHYKSHINNDNTRYTCHICGKFRNNLYRINVHMRLHSDPKVCEIDGCTKKFATLTELKAHQKFHFKGDKIFDCKTCGKAYRSEFRLKEHMALHTDPKVCDFPNCGKSFATASNLKIHRQIHSEETPYKCDWPGCEFATKSQSSLVSHKSRHYNDRPFKCDWPACDESFRRIETLNSHIAVQHKNERNFVCDFHNCGKRFAIERHLQSHKRSHSAEKRFTCDWPNCGRKFLQNYMLKKHLVIHTGERPYHCDWPGCEAKFGLAVTLGTHKKLVHKCDYIRRSRWDNKKKLL